MVTKMKYISITGHISEMNHTVNRYLSRYDIQLEPARHNLMKPFTTLNPYAQTFQKATRIAKIVGTPPIISAPITAAQAVNLVESASHAHDLRDKNLRALEERLAQLKREADALQNFSALDINLHALQNLEFIHHRFGRFTVENFRRFEKFLKSDKRVFFLTSKRDNEFFYGIFFSPMAHKDEIDAVFASLEFEIVEFSGQKTQGRSFPEKDSSPPPTFKNFSEGVKKITPIALIHSLRNEIIQNEKTIAELTQNVLSDVCGFEKLAIACAKVRGLYAAFDVKKYAAISEGRRIFTFSGWMSAGDADELEAELECDDLLLFTRHVIDDDAMPPTLLKNLPIVRQFEFFTRLYGLPEYGEIDPTPVLAVTYTLLFGLMFGDIGHGATLAIFGIYVQKRWHDNLGGIMTVVGISAALFGVLYGSVFGFEFRPLWQRPTTNINETLMFAAILGACLIAFSMLLNMYNSFRRGKISDFLFGANGVAGLLFYSAILWIFVRVFVQNRPVTALVLAVAILPLAIVFIKRPSEIFETLIAYATNTISFVRVGAFAVWHVGMMHVVLLLSRSAAGVNNFVFIFGNLLVIGIEGLLVGIQVLRLDFYEIFSRFYKSGGRVFAAEN
jgi:V/A-type H+-transporting ATPase subunit I